MTKTITAIAFAGAIALASLPFSTGTASAQAAGGPEPMQGAQPMDNAGGGGMEKSGGAMQKKSMKKSPAKKMKNKKSM